MVPKHRLEHMPDGQEVEPRMDLSETDSESVEEDWRCVEAKARSPPCQAATRETTGLKILEEWCHR